MRALPWYTVVVMAMRAVLITPVELHVRIAEL
jgi:hypothetical protein